MKEISVKLFYIFKLKHYKKYSVSINLLIFKLNLGKISKVRKSAIRLLKTMIKN